jgi:hypothetical protein
VPLAHPQQSEQAAGRGAERDVGVGDGEPACGLAGLDVAQGSRGQAGGDVAVSAAASAITAPPRRST